MAVKIGKRKVSVKHQVVLPEAVMSALGVAAGDNIEFILDGDQVIMRRADKP